MSRFRRHTLLSATPKWVIDAYDTYGIPYKKSITAYKKYGDIVKYALNNQARMVFDGASYFNTNICPYSDILMKMYCYTEAEGHMFGSRISYDDNSASFQVIAASDLYSIRLDFPGALQLTDVLWKKGVYANITMSRTYGKINGYSYSVTDKEFSTTQYPMYIGAGNTSNTPKYSANDTRIYWVLLSNTTDNTTSHFYIPVADNTLYDMIDETVLTNCGTGNAYIQEMPEDGEWIFDIEEQYNISSDILKSIYSIYGDTFKKSLTNESCLIFDGASYFNTNICPWNDIQMKCNFYIDSEGQLFGSRINTSDHSASFQIIGVAEGEICFDLPSGRTGTSIKYSDGIYLKAILSRYEAEINNNTYTVDSPVEFAETTYPMYIGAANTTINDDTNSGAIGESVVKYSASGTKFYWLCLGNYSDNTISHFYVPTADNTIIDLITGETLTNQGTGTANLITE